MRSIVRIFLFLGMLSLVAKGMQIHLGGIDHFGQAVGRILAEAAAPLIAVFVLMASPDNRMKQLCYQLTGPTAQNRWMLRDTTVSGVHGNDLVFGSIFMAALAIMAWRVAASAQALPLAGGLEASWLGLDPRSASAFAWVELWIVISLFALRALSRHEQGKDREAGEINQANWYPVYGALILPYLVLLSLSWHVIRHGLSTALIHWLQSGPGFMTLVVLGVAMANELARRSAARLFPSGSGSYPGNRVVYPSEVRGVSKPAETFRPAPTVSRDNAVRTANAAPSRANATDPAPAVEVPTRGQPLPAVETPPPAPIVFRPLGEASTVIRGQESAIEEIELVLKLACAGLTNRENKPLASFLFLGPTGVGKTETAKAIAEMLYGDPQRIARFNMNEAAGQGGQWRAFGPAPGYIGSDKGGQLTRQIEQHQGRCVILLDEMEKGPQEIFDALLTGLDEGYVEDASFHKRLSIQDAVVIMTSNILADEIETLTEQDLRIKVQRTVIKDPRLGEISPFRPEFVGRIQRIIPFRPLGVEHFLQILSDRYERHFAPRILHAKGMCIPVMTPTAANFVLSCIEGGFGGRQVDRQIEQWLMFGLLELDGRTVPNPAVWHYDPEARRLMLIAPEQAAQVLEGSEEDRQAFYNRILSGVAKLRSKIHQDS